MWNLFDILRDVLGLLKAIFELLTQIRKTQEGLKSGKRPRKGRSRSQTIKKKK